MTDTTLITPRIPLAFDFGGTLIKVAFFLPDDRAADAAKFLHSFHHPDLGGFKLGGYLCFEKFPSGKPQEFLDFVKHYRLIPETGHGGGALFELNATGGGAHNVAQLALFEREIHVRVHALDELSCVVRGLNTMQVIHPESLLFQYDFRKRQTVPVLPDAHHHFPYLLVNCGSGVSILRVDGPTTFQRVSGTSLGGGTFLGLARALSGIESFDEIKEASTHGENASVDLLVGDIYGGDYAAVGLPADVIASSCAKLHAHQPPEPHAVLRSLLKMVSNNISQLAYLNAQLHKVHHVVFTGFFVRNNEPMWHTISFGFDFWSQGKFPRPMFVTADGFLGAVGAFAHQFGASPTAPAPRQAAEAGPS